MLQVIFGDDEHTAADGPYPRIMKARKWLYMGSIAAIFLAVGLYDAKEAKNIVKFVSLPAGMIGNAVLIWLGYVLFQYILLICQLISTYDIVLGERLTFRRADELARVADQENSARSALDAARKSAFESEKSQIQVELSSFRSQKKILSTERTKLNREMAKIKDKDILNNMNRKLQELRKQITDLENKIRDKNDELSNYISGTIVENQESVISARQAVEVAAIERQRLVAQIPSNRRGYVFLERCIDTSRIGLPLIFSIYAEICLYISLDSKA